MLPMVPALEDDEASIVISQMEPSNCQQKKKISSLNDQEHEHNPSSTVLSKIKIEIERERERERNFHYLQAGCC